MNSITHISWRHSATARQVSMLPFGPIGASDWTLTCEYDGGHSHSPSNISSLLPRDIAALYLPTPLRLYEFTLAKEM